MTGITNLGNLTQSSTMLSQVRQQAQKEHFDNLVKSAVKDLNGTVSSDQVAVRDTRLNGEFTSDYSGTYTSEADKTAKASGFAANSAKAQGKTIDKTSKLYEKSLELESFFVKMMVDSMRKTVSKSDKGENGFAQKMYEDMLYDEYTTALTKNAGFGIADSIYLELSR